VSVVGEVVLHLGKDFSAVLIDDDEPVCTSEAGIDM
jgi:hypothetical protein